MATPKGTKKQPRRPVSAVKAKAKPVKAKPKEEDLPPEEEQETPEAEEQEVPETEELEDEELEDNEEADELPGSMPDDPDDVAEQLASSSDKVADFDEDEDEDPSELPEDDDGEEADAEEDLDAECAGAMERDRDPEPEPEPEDTGDGKKHPGPTETGRVPSDKPHVAAPPKDAKVHAKAGRVIVDRHYKNPDIEDESEEETLEVRQFATFPANVSYMAGATVNLGDYESAKVSVTVTLPCYVEELDDAYEHASAFVSERIEEEVNAIRNARDGVTEDEEEEESEDKVPDPEDEEDEDDFLDELPEED